MFSFSDFGVMQWFIEPETKSIILTALVLSKLKYCWNVWEPYYEIHKYRIEKVQKRFWDIFHFTSFS